MKKILLTASSVLLTAIMSYGAGFQLNLQGLRQLAMGGTGTAVPWDASTIFYNPAGISLMDGIQAYASGQFIMPRVEYAQQVGPYTAYTSPQTFPTFNAYVGGPVQYEGKWGVGLGIYTPFGSGNTWPSDWAGNQIVQSIRLSSIFIQPTASYKINDQFSVGLGLIYAYGNLDFKQALPLQNQSGQTGGADLTGNAWGLGFNAGVHYKASDKVQLGLTYRSGVNMKLNKGAATFNNVPTSLASEFPNTSFSSNVPLPAVLSLGVGVMPAEHLTLQADVQYTFWQTFDSLDFNFNQQTSGLTNIHLPRKYNNTLAVRIGGNYDFFDGKLSVMAGMGYDPTPVPDGIVPPDLPDANRFLFTGGLCYRPVEKLAIMAAVEYTVSDKRLADYTYEGFSGQYQTKAITPGIGLVYNFYTNY